MSYCFDVLYHVIGDDAFQRSINNLCASTNRYVLVHGMFPQLIPVHLVAHVKFRTQWMYDAAFKRNGFIRVDGEPTHFFMMRPLLYKVFGLFPGIASTIDGILLMAAKKIGLSGLSAYKIVVYERFSEVHVNK